VQTGEGRPAPNRRDGSAADELPREALRELVGGEAGLLRRLRETMPEQFAHTGRIAEVSARAAAHIGADELFCEAVAWYREIGKLEDQSDFSASGERLMHEADMPEELISSVRMAGMKNAAAKNRETAIVVLTANVITELEAAKPGKAKDGKAKSGKTDISRNRMVDNIFLVRLIKGTLDESGLTVRDYSRLRQFFLTEFGLQEKQKKGE
ncbi:MAG: hypothetical protein K2N94_00550, partial [Lachnospiraceae bacterium]|nr:hypothetical protein [Lachnospiraceae bacterium]